MEMYINGHCLPGKKARTLLALALGDDIYAVLNIPKDEFDLQEVSQIVCPKILTDNNGEVLKVALSEDGQKIFIITRKDAA